jgi:glycosyltransferase involved in cell wall biosynthesis
MQRLQPDRIHILRLEQNAGKAEAVQRGVQAALQFRPKFVGYWDADLATPLDAITRFSDILEARDELSLVMGSRVALLGRKIERNGLRHILGRSFATAASLILRLPVYDTQCGAKLFRVTPQLSALFAAPFRSRWIFDVELLARFVSPKDGYTNRLSAIRSIYEYPLENWQDVEGSRLRARVFALAGFELATIYWCYMRRANAKPILGRLLPSRPVAERRAAA